MTTESYVLISIHSGLNQTKIVSWLSKNMLSIYKNVNCINKNRKNKYIFHVLCSNIENFSRNLYFKVGGLDVRVRALMLVCANYK